MMRVYYDRDADINLIKDKKVRHRRLWQPGPRPCPEPARQRRQGRRIALREGSATAKKAEGEGFKVMTWPKPPPGPT
jgi:ketol-acid reductoisomerase